MVWINQEEKIIMEIKIITSLGTKVRVCSWILVVVWTMEIIKPTTMPKSSMGADSFRVIQMASRPRLMISASDNLSPVTSYNLMGQKRPSVNHNK